MRTAASVECFSTASTRLDNRVRPCLIRDHQRTAVCSAIRPSPLFSRCLPVARFRVKSTLDVSVSSRTKFDAEAAQVIALETYELEEKLKPKQEEANLEKANLETSLDDSDSTTLPSKGEPTFAERLLNIPPRVKGLVLLNLLVFLVATNWVVVKETGDLFDPFAFAFFRFGVAAVAFAPFWRSAFSDADLRKAGLELGLWSAAGYLTQSVGLLMTDASRASFLSTFTVIVVPLLAGFTGRGVKPAVWAAVLAAIVGVGLLEQSGTAFGAGDVWSFLSAVFFGIQVFRTEIVSRRLNHTTTLPLMSIVMATIAVSSGICAAAVHPAATLNFVMNPLNSLPENLPWLAILYTGILSTDLALICEFEALQHVSSTEAALVYTLEPVLGAGFAYVLLGERWGTAGWIGAALIIASSAFTQIYGVDPEPVSDKQL